MQEALDYGLPKRSSEQVAARAPSTDPAFTASVQKGLTSAFDENSLRDVLRHVPGELQHRVYWQQPLGTVVGDVLAVLRDRADGVVPFADAVIAARPGRPDVQALAHEMRVRGTV
jgi:hypothetical protein